MQQSLYQPMLTVREAMNISADLKLGKDLDRAEKNEVVLLMRTNPFKYSIKNLPKFQNKNVFINLLDRRNTGFVAADQNCKHNGSSIVGWRTKTTIDCIGTGEQSAHYFSRRTNNVSIELHSMI